jgi:molybdopterin-guanine dinucleotide biosynthesis protein A
VTIAGGVVLCGGRSSRMGRPKAWLPVGDELMLQRVVRIVSGVVTPLVVVAAPGQDVPTLPARVEVVRDEVEGQGPLSGLAAGLTAMQGKAEVAYLSACDVPLLRAGFVRQVLAHRPGGVGVEGDGAKITVPRIADFYHPLAAAYRVDLLPIVRSLLATGERRMTALFDVVPTRCLDQADFTDLDPHLESLRNVNTLQEYETVLFWLRGQSG